VGKTISKQAESVKKSLPNEVKSSIDVSVKQDVPP
jgi:hypothetical protein